MLLQQILADVNHPDHILITYPNLGHEFYPSTQWQTQQGPIQQYVLRDLFYGLKPILSLHFFLPINVSIFRTIHRILDFSNHNIINVKKGYLKNSSICFVRKFGLSSGMKCPVFGNVIPVTLFATF